MPLIPLSLVNGSEGIGTGYSSSVPNFAVHDIINNVKRLVAGEECEPMLPYYRGFSGSVEPVAVRPSPHIMPLP